MSTTIIHDRKQRSLKQLEEMKLRREAHQNQELRGHLRAAYKLTTGKSKAPLDVLEMSDAEQISLLEKYAAKLEDEAKEFLERWPDRDGQNAARWFRVERSRVLDHLVRLKISLAKGAD